MRVSTKLKVMAGATALVVGGSVAAFAYWTTGGTGTGSATTGNVAGITINQTSSPTGLYPGGLAANLTTTFDNGNASAVQIHQVTAAVTAGFTSSAIDSGQPPCTAADFTVSPTQTLDTEIPAGVTAGPTFTIKLDDRATNQDNCKAVIVPITYTSN